MPKWQWILKNFSGKLWLRATIFCFVGVAAALAAVAFKHLIPIELSQKIGADSVSTILEILAGSMLAVTTFSVSATVTAYVAAGAAATPRAARLLTEDNTSQNALSVFVGSFLFSLVGIVALEAGIYGETGRPILFAATLGVIFVITATLLRWIHYLTHVARVGHAVDVVEKAVAKAIDVRLRRPYLGGSPLPEGMIYDGMHEICCDAIGYIQFIDMETLSDMATAHDFRIFVQALPGAFNDGNRPLAFASKSLNDAEKKCVCAAFSVKDDRTFEQDPRYGVMVLSEIAAKALSPGINDYGTAIDVIGTVVRVMTPWVKYDESQPPEPLYPHIYIPSLQLKDAFDDAFAAISRDGAGIHHVMVRLQKAYASLAEAGGRESEKQARRRSNIAVQHARGRGNLLPHELEHIESLEVKPLS